MSVRVLAGIALLGLVLGGCGGLRSKAEADRIYVLNAASPAGAPVAAATGVLLVLRPAVQPGLETDRIALTRGDNELDFFAGSRWGEALPRVVSALAVQSFAGGGGFATVLDAGRAAVAADYELMLTVRHFEAAYGQGEGAPTARVAFECVLTAGVPRRVLGRCDAEAAEPAGENRMGPIVGALERAAHRALGEVRAQALAAAAQARR